MKTIGFLIPVFLFITNHASAAEQERFFGEEHYPIPPNRDALIFTVNRVQCLQFNTDRPVKQARLLINGTEVAKDGWHADATGFKLAVIKPSQRILSQSKAEPQVQVHVQTSNMGGMMTGPYRETVESNLIRLEYFGPGTNVTLAGWTEVYGVKHLLGTNLVYDLRVQIR